MPDNLSLIKLNCEYNSIHCEIHEVAIDQNDGNIRIYYDKLDTSLKINGTGMNSLMIKTRSVTDAIQSSNADVAKFDCEGSEASLEYVEDAVLRKIQKYIIECHSKAIGDTLKIKFKEAGFDLNKEIKRSGEISVVAFSLPDR